MVSWRKFLRMEPEPEGKPFRQPVFVIGCMRSGTTFLADKLSQHPQLIKVGSELRDVWTSIGGALSEGAVSELKSADDATAATVANLAAYYDSFVRDSRSIRRHLMRAKNRMRFKQGRIFYDWDRVIPVNKSTQLINKISYVHALFPESRIVLIVRSIEGHSASMKAFIEHNYDKQQIVHVVPEESGYSWSRVAEDSAEARVEVSRRYPGNFETIPQMWIRLNRLALDDLRHLPADLFRVVRYEDLVGQQESELNRVFSFLPVDRDYESLAQSIAKSKLPVTNTTTSGDPATKWQRQLDDTEKRTIDLLKDTEDYLGVDALIAELSDTR